MKKLTISIIGVPLDLGQSRRGVNMGPSAIRYAGAVARLEAIGHQVIDEGAISGNVTESVKNHNSGIKNLEKRKGEGWWGHEGGRIGW